MKRYLQCAEQQESASNFSKYCACHAKWISWLILVTHETLFTMRGVTTVIVQTHQILRLPRKMNLMIDPCHTWNAIYNARSNKCHCPNSPNTAPATQSNTHHWSLSHMKRYLQCAEQQVSLSKLTKYCACHAKWLSWYCHDWSSSHMKRYLQCAEQQVASSNITKYCACHAKWFSKISETFLQNRWNVNSNARPIRDRSENDPSMIRAWSEHETVIRNPPRNRGYFQEGLSSSIVQPVSIIQSVSTIQPVSHGHGPGPVDTSSIMQPLWRDANNGGQTKYVTWAILVMLLF